MYREIKFRGLRIDGKGWVYGSFIHNSIDCPCIIDYDAEQYEVIPESAGQFTGLKDKNGVEIYEGDKLSNNRDSRIESITFSDGAFYLTHSNVSRRLSITVFGLEVIGNIHQEKEVSNG